MNLFAILIILVTQSLSSLVFATPLNQKDHLRVDRVALLTIKSHITHDPTGFMNSWNDSLPICQWQGVICGAKISQRRRVVGLNLQCKGLVGTLSPAVGNLSFLHHLFLFNNSFQGHIPPQIAQLFRLRLLDLRSNSFEGQVPSNISHCLNLEYLGMGWNKLGGTIPPALSLLPKLTYLLLQNNSFSGNLLNVVMNMTSLQVLYASGNSFHGIIPDGIGRCKNLATFGIGQNKISGKIPPSFYNLSSLKYMDLSDNQLEGSLPLDIGLLFPQLENFRIQNNCFHGHVPFSLSNFTQLIELDISYNNFSGKFIFSGQNMLRLQCLHIFHNFLGTGEEGDLNFVQTLSNCNQLQRLLCSYNNFGGVLPNCLGNLTALTYMEFRYNHLTGIVPPGLFNLTKLEGIMLQGNHLTGSIPLEIGKLNNLEKFYCSDNNLIGYIPYTVGNLSRLSELDLGRNSFEGMIPSSLGNCTNLLQLSLSQNNLNGSLPPHLFHASMLVGLDLSQNHLQGHLPTEIEKLKQLLSLNVSANAFSGEIPSGLGDCISLSDLEMGGNFFTGSIPESFKSLTGLRNLNLSHNRLFGPIPGFLSSFPLIKLDLSFNSLEGEVPREGAFANASVVSVSGNLKLCGGISDFHLSRCQARKGYITLTVALAAACLVLGVSIMFSVYLLCVKRKRNKLSRQPSMESFSKVSYDMLLKATDRFSEANLIGKGSFGSVYKGVLDPDRMIVAVKVLNLENEGATKSFMAECNALRNIRHRNLLKIVTTCSSTDFQGNDFKALVYEFVPNGNLQKWIHVDPAMTNQSFHHLSLLQRLNIAIDVACAVDYLHNSCEVPLIHCDLKPSNILLDKDMVARVGDFGLARFHSNASTSSSIAVKGTMGYAAPEYGLGSMVSKEGDVYSYGILLIEMMTAKKPTDCVFDGGLNLHQHAKSALPDQLEKVIDPRLVYNNASGNPEENLAESGRKIECIKSVIIIGLKCSVESPQYRMSIGDAMKELQSTRDVFVRARSQQHVSSNEHETQFSICYTE